MAQVSQSSTLYAYFNSAWTALNDVAPWRGSWGINSNGPLDRVASTGEMTFALDNSGGLYTPGGPTALTGWKKGIPFKWVITFDGEPFIRFRGFIADIDIRPSIQKLAYVTALDWMDYAARHPLINPGIQTNQRGDEVLTTVLGTMGIQPQVREFDEGTETFPTAFDTVRTTTRALTEFSKVALSELGYVYVKHDQWNGETLVFENADARPMTRDAEQIPKVNPDFLLLETGDKLLLETGDKLLLNETEAVAFNGSIVLSFDAPYGDMVINRMLAKVPPRRLDTTPQILFRLDAPIRIGAGATITIKGSYADPAGGGAITGQDMIDPVITTDYTANTKKNGNGTNITSSLTIVTDYGTAGFEHTVTNGNASPGWIRLFNCRGTGIYIYNPIQYEASDAASITEFGYHDLSFEQQYKDELDTAGPFADSVVDEFKQPAINLTKIRLAANRSNANMMAFLYTDVGFLRRVTLTELGLDLNYYVQGVEFEVNGGIIMYSWALMQSPPSFIAGLTPLVINFSSAGNTDAVAFPPSAAINNLSQKSYSCWLYFTFAPGGNIFSKYVTPGDGGEVLQADGGGTGKPEFMRRNTITAGAWNTTNNVWTALINSWAHVVVTYDAGLLSNDPLIYINGTSVAITKTATPDGDNDDSANNLVIGSLYDSSIQVYQNSFQGKILDFRIYNRILTQAEITTLYNSGTPSATTGAITGLVLQAFGVSTANAPSYIGATLTEAQTLRDGVFRSIGVPYNGPVASAAP